MSIAKEHALMWLDTETTGLNPHKDQLLEIGVIVTSMDGEEVIYQRSTVLYHEALTITQDMLAAVRMHMANGLLDECLDYGKSTSHEDAYARYYHELASLTDRYVLHPAGSNVQFDLAFVDAHAPGKYHHGGNSDRGFWEYLAHYRRFDLTALRLLWRPDLPAARPRRIPSHARTIPRRHGACADGGDVTIWALAIIAGLIAMLALAGVIKDAIDLDHAIKAREERDREWRAHELRVIADHEARHRTETEEQ